MPTALAMAAAAFLLTLGLGYPGVGYLRRAGVAKQVSSNELPLGTMFVSAAPGAYDDRLSLVGSRGGGLATVIMGDTGALALGATLAVVALMLGQVLLHRHFEMLGWGQMQVARRFWLISHDHGAAGGGARAEVTGCTHTR